MSKTIMDKSSVHQQNAQRTRMPGYLGRGQATSVKTNVNYRLGKLQKQDLLHGLWLDCGCAEGGYTVAMLNRGAEGVIGIDVEVERVLAAQGKKPASTSINYGCGTSESLPFAEASFDGVFLNEVFEHVADEVATLKEIRRVLRPGGHLVLISPNRYFPFEGHGMRINKIRLAFPIPLLPWLPSKLTMKYVCARNYWPHELKNMLLGAGFEVLSTSSVLPVLEVYQWLPAPAIQWYRRAMPILEMTPIIRQFGVSIFVLAKRPGEMVQA